MNVIDITGLDKSYGSRTIISGATLAIGEGEKVGVIGRNGSGKSTLLKILAGLEDSDSGSVVRKRSLAATYLPQEPELDPEKTIRQTLDGCLAEAQTMLFRFQELAHALPGASPEEAQKLMVEQQKVQDWLDLHGTWNLDHKVATVCDRLGISMLDQRVGNLSGGWTKRVALAGVLLREPELLLLDEPTNHLDADTVAWLEEILRGYPGAVVLVTHDRYFLDRVATRMFELDHGVITVYGGGYSDYLEKKQERLAREGRAQGRLMNLLRREEAWLKRGAKARTTKQKARIDRVQDLRERKKDLRTREVKLDFSQEQRLGGTVLELDNLGVSLGERELIDDLSFIMRRGDRIGVLGPNGCGKTTLLRTVLGQLPPRSGRVVLGVRTRIGYLDQERSGLDPEFFVHEALGEGDWVTLPGGEKRHKIGYLEDFLFSAAEQKKRVSTLSGGERARLLLAKLMLEGANFLILDEPTNDLDIPTLQVLEEAFNDFPGCLLVVTHDRWFLDRVVTGILHFEGEKKVTYFEGNYADLQRFREFSEEVVREESRTVPAPVAKESAPKKRPGLSYKERLELEKVEGRIAALEDRRSELEGMLAEPETLGGDHNRLARAADEFTAVEAELATLLERWEELELKKEGAGA
jgi:ATP-binding cassette subfamily F protein uup